jgi:hypothetical protein
MVDEVRAGVLNRDAARMPTQPSLVRDNTDLGRASIALSLWLMNTEGDSQGHGELESVEEQRVSLGDLQQTQEWALKLGISPERLRELVAQVGPRICDLQQRLSQPDSMD